MSAKGNEVMTIKPLEEMKAEMMQFLSEVGFAELMPTFLTSIDGKTKAGSELIFSLINGKGERAKSKINLELYAENYLISKAKIQDDESGQVSDKLLTRLVAPDGSWIQTTSPVVAKGVMLYHMTQRQAPWTPALKYRIIEVPTKSPLAYLAFEPIIDRLADQGKAKR